MPTDGEGHFFAVDTSPSDAERVVKVEQAQAAHPTRSGLNLQQPQALSFPFASVSRDSAQFRFGLPATASRTASQHSGHSTPAMSASVSAGLNWPAGTPSYTISAQDYDEEDDEGLDDTPFNAKGGKDKAVRRRSSKACDQCRKSKCKCERSTPEGPCRNCTALKTGKTVDCTFLGPSRKRGPPKGYIDAIEARLHQTEALVGILLAAGGVRILNENIDARGRQVTRHGIDERAKELMADMAEDPVARAILVRIDQSAYGPSGRSGMVSTGSASGRGSPVGKIRGNGASSEVGDLGSMHPSHEWMDRVTESLLRRAQTRREKQEQQSTTSPHSPTRHPDGLSPYGYSYQQMPHSQPPQRPAIITALNETNRHPYPHSAGPLGDKRVHSAGADAPSYYSKHLPLSAAVDGRPMPFDAGGNARRVRRRVGGGVETGAYYSARPTSPEASDSDSDLDLDIPEQEHRSREREASSSRLRRQDSMATGLAGAVGQLSLNEDKEVRYHGKASGLHLLARHPVPSLSQEQEVTVKREEDGQNAGGIWRFPKARVWPAAPPPEEWDADGVINGDKDGLPPRDVQGSLLERYFAHVHPSFPVIHKQSIMEAFSRGEGPPLLLLAMYALAARHAPQPAHEEIEARQCMWPAGDTFLFRAKTLLDSSYASSRASTCAALLLLGFREIGIGAMAQAWTYIGMAVRMAQDLGLHRDADGWVRAGVKVGRTAAMGGAVEGGTPLSSHDDDREPSLEQDDGRHPKDGKLFAAWEIAERRRIWYACVIMDKYVSTYIGRPLSICERDYDTSLPSESDCEETEQWYTSSEAPVQMPPRPGHVISCFNASARLSTILSQMLQSIYALRPQGSRHAELVVLDGDLEKWRLALPPHLQYDPAVRMSAAEVPLPPVLTLHMQYWCAVLLLYRPFIRHNKTKSPLLDDSDSRGHAEKSYELCASAANHITTIATLYSETYTLKHCAVFLCYYTFTASIMHVTSLFLYSKDPQARMGLTKCMEALREMEIIWPAAARALVLLRGAQTSLVDVASEMDVSAHQVGRKRSATQTLDDSFAGRSDSFVASRPYDEVYDNNNHYTIPSRESFYAPPSNSSFQRWQPSEELTFQGGDAGLSTAVMGPTYSTGLVDERSRQPRYPHQPPTQQYWAYSEPTYATSLHHSATEDPQMYQPYMYRQ
ncbi:Zn(2)-C6 fungal-type domain-containing protein [Mycena indigotica]|uniref:Zn(2)-C6 fungal-type domain-containing protein n=1 Tax=Mycena indigotica TaxID=2126181 RepID=A0A8H6S727_9AGAR|nr:Zn(2)-C6 fungal-type domain-containing protein [Mycena indigotica]KAF7293007.1 Zn(2)-C6 fungal-type domain-containing protein [Mycena indigotica]